MVKKIEKLKLYKVLLKLFWTNGVKIWGSVKKIQPEQNLFVRLITKEPFYVSNQTFHSDLEMITIVQTATIYYTRIAIL